MLRHSIYINSIFNSVLHSQSRTPDGLDTHPVSPQNTKLQSKAVGGSADHDDINTSGVHFGNDVWYADFQFKNR